MDKSFSTRVAYAFVRSKGWHLKGWYVVVALFILSFKNNNKCMKRYRIVLV